MAASIRRGFGVLYSKSSSQYCAEVFVCAADGAVLSSSRNYAALTGYAPGEPVSFYDHVVPEDRRQVRQAFLSCTAEQSLSCRGICRDGMPVEYMLYLVPGGQSGVLRCTLFDMTDAGRLRKEWERVNQWLETLTANLQGGMFHYRMGADRRIRVDFISEGMLAILGCTDQQFWERYDGDISRIICAEDQERLFPPSGLRPGNLERFEYRIVTYTGEIRWVTANRQVLRMADGSLEAYVVVNDVTETYRVRREFEDIANSVPGGVARIRLDPQLHVLYMTDGFCQLSQRTREEFLADTHGETARVIHPDDLPGVYRIMEEQRKNAVLSLELRIIRKDGSTAWIHVTARKIVETEDIFQGVFIDITDSKLAQQDRERLLRERNELINAIPGGVLQFTLGASPKCLFASDGFYALGGYTREEYTALFGKDFYKMVYPPDLPELKQSVDTQFGAGEKMTSQYRIVRKDGRIRWLSFSGNRSVEPDGTEIYRCIYTDITDVKQTEQELLYEKERYCLILDCMENITYEYDLEQDRMTFYYRSLDTGRQDSHVLSPYTALLRENAYVAPEYQDLVLKMLRGECPGDPQEILALRPENRASRQYTWHEIRNVAVRDADGEIIRSIGILMDIDDRKRETIRLRYRSERDSLTGLYNKAACFANISDYLKQGDANRIHAVLMIDFDDFKAVNDTFGHQYGDAILSRIGKGMRRLFRESDVVGRIGGDEFLVFMKDLVDEGIVREKAGALCSLFRKLYPSEKGKISGSVGISFYPKDGRSYEELLRKADLALYGAKKSGKDSYQFYTSETNMNVQLSGLDSGKREMENVGKPASALTDSFAFLQTTVLMLNQDQPEHPLRDRLPQILELLGRYCSGGRAFLLAGTDLDGGEASWKVEWRAPGVTGEVSFLHDDERLEYIRRLNAADAVYFSVDEAQEVENPSLTARMRQRGAVTTLQAPIRCSGRLEGILGIDDCRVPRPWTKREVEVLTTLANLLGVCIAASYEKEGMRWAGL